MNASAAPSPRRRPRFSDERGSVLIVALIFAAIIAVSIGSFVRVGQTNLEVSSRAFYHNAAINLAESGLEQAMWSINQLAADETYDWSSDGWSTDATSAWQKFDGFSFDQNASGSVRVFVQNRSGTPAPVLVARATIQPARGDPIEKWIKVELSKRSLFANGLVAKDWISFSGNGASVDSYDSRKGAYNAVLADGSRNRFGRGSAGSGAVTVDSFSLGNADIWGYVSIGTADYTGLDVGPNGTVAGLGSSQGTIDYSRVTTDFRPNFEDVEAPTTAPYTIGSVTNATTLPLAGHTPAADGKYYYSTPSISLSGGGSKILAVSSGATVVLTVTTDSGTAVSVSGNASIAVPTNANLEMYTSGNVAIAGNGVVNSNQPAAFQLYGTRTADAASEQSISISGNGQLSAVVYAPNANLSMNGGGSSGSVLGAAVAKTVTVTGGSAFHYDEALADMTDGNPFGITRWAELTTSTARNAWDAHVSF